MTYAIRGLSRAPFADLFTLDDQALAARSAIRVVATSRPGFHCRVSLDEAEIGERLILVHHLSHDVATPYRSAYAIYVRDVPQAAPFVDQIPPVLAGRTIGLRGFDQDGMLRDAALAPPGRADEAIRGLFANADIAYIHAHNAAHGCFVAQVDRA